MSSGAPEETPKPNQESSQTQTGQAELPPSKTPLLSLPAPGDVTSHSSISASLNSDGSISMDHLGPMVVSTWVQTSYRPRSQHPSSCFDFSHSSDSSPSNRPLFLWNSSISIQR